jgi:hypothetical protein
MCASISVGYDPWQSPHIAQQLRVEGVPMHEFRATTQNCNPTITDSMRACELAGYVMTRTLY